MARSLVSILLGLLAVGCRTFTRPEENPLVVEAVGPVQVLASTPDRRLVLVDGASGGLLTDSPPDVFEEATRRLEALLRSKVSESGETDVQAALEGARTIAQLSPRSQGLLLFREGSYRLTEAWLNGQLDAVGYGERIDRLIEDCVELIEFQLLLNPRFGSAPGDGPGDSPDDTRGGAEERSFRSPLSARRGS